MTQKEITPNEKLLRGIFNHHWAEDFGLRLISIAEYFGYNCDLDAGPLFWRWFANHVACFFVDLGWRRKMAHPVKSKRSSR